MILKLDATPADPTPSAGTPDPKPKQDEIARKLVSLEQEVEKLKQEQGGILEFLKDKKTPGTDSGSIQLGI